MFIQNIYLVASAALVALSQALPTTPAAASTPVGACGQDDQICVTDALLFDSTLDQFLALRSQNYKSPPLSYESDGCSVPREFVEWLGLINKDRPYNRYNFLNACFRHDFAYENYKRQKRFTKTNKKPIDNKFKEDLVNGCRAQFANPSTVQPAGATLEECEKTANTYYLGVAIYFGGIQGEKIQFDAE
ncbi:hypothetical protein Dda_4195 [Drechslerella dactyloides]|uniref:Uncharacterized protein n=1 Tax=Drechslerella dactyloides TaxID=74499 RepID=A0AAD6J1M3_DREDA|nr:hypothetical protein Dda_4195 [Drechslerella dactyloides]